MHSLFLQRKPVGTAGVTQEAKPEVRRFPDLMPSELLRDLPLSSSGVCALEGVHMALRIWASEPSASWVAVSAHITLCQEHLISPF